ncbi:MAG: Holliday junction resolvase RuvX [Acidimicrobiia bacterium]|nr:Holliday junction resolvase RuvX [Acidimicrobiia bacterium]
MGRLMGIDYGTKRVGIALSDPTHLIASPLMVCDRETAIDVIAGAVRAHDVESIVIGMPTSLSGEDGPSAAAARAFASEVANTTGLAVEVEDERFTSVLAERSMIESGTKRSDRRKSLDGVAAALILQSYLDRQ